MANGGEHLYFICTKDKGQGRGCRRVRLLSRCRVDNRYIERSQPTPACGRAGLETNTTFGRGVVYRPSSRDETLSRSRVHWEVGTEAAGGEIVCAEPSVLVGHVARNGSGRVAPGHEVCVQRRHLPRHLGASPHAAP